MTAPQTTCPAPSTAMLTANDVAGILNCSPRTVRRFADLGRIPPPVRLGRLVRWPRASIEAWLAEGCPGVKSRRRGR